MMATILNWSILKANLYRVLLSLPLLLLAQLTLAQSFSNGSSLALSHSIPISSPSTISQDRNGAIYFLDAKRTLYKIDSQGRLLLSFSPPSRGRISTIEAWNPMKILLFYEDRQELVLLDRFLRPISNTQLTDLGFTGIVRAATPSSDDGFWLFNETDFTLQKLDLRSRSNSVETALNLVMDNEQFDVRFLREYQNMVYMLDANAGIYVFDSLGNFKKKLPYTGLSYIGFAGNEVYFVKENKLYFYDLYQQQERTLELPGDNSYEAALVSDKQVYLFSKKQLDIYTLQP